MPTYQYTAMDANGKERKGRLDASDEAQANGKLREMGLFPTSIDVAKGDTRPKGTPTRKPKRKTSFGGIVLGTPKMKRKAVTTFTRQLAILLKAGLPLVRSLRTLESQMVDVTGRLVIGDISDQVEGGKTFSEGLAGHPKTFDKLYVNMVRAGEVSGAMEAVLNRVAGYREKSQRIRSRVKSALTYPVVVLVIALLITTGLLYFIVPRFAKMFEDMLSGEPLPLITRFVVGVSQFVKDRFLLVAVLLGVAAVAFALFKRTKMGGYVIDYVLLKAPPFGSLMTKSCVARFSATLSTLMNAGVSILNSLQIVRDTAGNAVLAEAIQRVHNSVKEGESVSRPLRESRAFPGMVCSMIEVGEETGELPEMLGEIASVYEEEVDLAVDALTALIEPMMICGLGVLIGGIVLAMFMPLIGIITGMTG